MKKIKVTLATAAFVFSMLAWQAAGAQETRSGQTSGPIKEFLSQQAEIALAIRSANSCAERGDWQRAKSILWDINEIYPGDVTVTLELAKLEIRDKRFREALSVLKSGLQEIKVLDDQRYVYMGYALIKSGYRHESLQMWTPTLMSSDYYTDWVSMLPQVETASGLEAAWLMAIARRNDDHDVPGNLENWVEVLKLAPGNAIAAGRVATFLRGQKKYPESIAHYEMAIKNAVPGRWRENMELGLKSAKYEASIRK